MVKCIDKGAYTCISKHGKKKHRYDTSEEAITAAKIINDKNNDTVTKLVAYKCSHCFGYHLTTHFKRIRK